MLMRRILAAASCIFGVRGIRFENAVVDFDSLEEHRENSTAVVNKENRTWPPKDDMTVFALKPKYCCSNSGMRDTCLEKNPAALADDGTLKRMARHLESFAKRPKSDRERSEWMTCMSVFSQLNENDTGWDTLPSSPVDAMIDAFHRGAQVKVGKYMLEDGVESFQVKSVGTLGAFGRRLSQQEQRSVVRKLVALMVGLDKVALECSKALTKFNAETIVDEGEYVVDGVVAAMHRGSLAQMGAAHVLEEFGGQLGSIAVTTEVAEGLLAVLNGEHLARTSACKAVRAIMPFTENVTGEDAEKFHSMNATCFPKKKQMARNSAFRGSSIWAVLLGLSYSLQHLS